MLYNRTRITITFNRQFKSNLPGLSIENEGHSAEITTVDEVEGDVDLGQRKGK
jgi:activator of HSP90 ATPase